MSHTVTVASMITRVRHEFDLETTDEADSIAPDANLVTSLNRAYRDLYELVCDTGAGPEHFGTSNAAFASPWTLAATVFRVLDIDVTENGQTVPAKKFTFAERNDYSAESTPRWCEYGNAIVWRPSDPTGTVTLWYIATPADLAAGDSVNVWNGWDDFMVLSAGIVARRKQEYDCREFIAERENLRARIRREAGKRKASANVIADVRKQPDRAFYNG